MPTHKPATVSASSSSNRKPAARAPAAAPAAAPTPPTPPTPPAPPAPTPPPQPTPDPNAALAAFAQQAVAMIDTITAGLGGAPTLAPSDKRRAVRFRKGGGPIAGTIGDLAQQQQLELPALPVATMTSLLGRASALAPLVNRLPAFVTLVDDIVFAAKSQAWSMALQYYAILHRRAKSDAKVAAALQPVTAFLSYRHPSTKPAVGSPTTKQVNAAKKAQKALATVAGGKLAGTNLLNPRKKPASSASTPFPAAPAASPAPTGNGAPPAGASPATNGGTPPATHS
jgi:hypothetical protein